MAFLDEAGLEYFYKKLIDKIFPVGSVYMSADTNFNPNNSWGGTWEKIENRFLLGSGTRGVGATGGEENVTLTISQIPSHKHSVGDIQSTGSVYASCLMSAGGTANGGFQIVNPMSGHSTPRGVAWGDSVRGLSYSMALNRSGNTGSSGGNLSHNNMPPFTVVNIWKRTA